MTKLGINIDHVATVRQARKEKFPDPLALALQAVNGGADGITAHLREDRRHIQDHDAARLAKELSVPFNLEMASSPEIVDIACSLKPTWCCLVPEKREELTTEGGLDVKANFDSVRESIAKLHEAGIKVSLFIDPDDEMIQASHQLKAESIEIHTGPYARAWNANFANGECCTGTGLALRTSYEHELRKVVSGAKKAQALGLQVNAGHGIDYQNVGDLNKSFSFNEFNIGFAIVAKSLEIGMEQAVQSMKEKMKDSVCVES